jgi:phosphonoacetaldehyde hydrolase
MCCQKAINLEVYPLSQMVKVGDTTSDITEGINAVMWTFGVIKGRSELGPTEEEVRTMDRDVLEKKIKAVYEKFKAAGAHDVIDTISDLEEVIVKLNACLEEGRLAKLQFPCGENAELLTLPEYSIDPITR